MKLCSATILSSLLFSASTLAQVEPENIEPTDVTKPAKKPLQGEVELGLINTSGNTESSSLKSKLSITHDLTHWRNNYEISTFYKDEEVEANGVRETQVSEEKYFASVQGNYKLINNGSALFLYASYEDDRFSGFDYQQSFAAGYSNKVIDNDTTTFTYNAGPGYRFSKLDTGDTEEGGFIRLAIDFKYQITETARFSQALSTEAAVESDDNTRTKSETAISASILGSLSLKAAFIIDNNTEVPAGVEDTDTETTLSVLYIF